MMIGLDTAAFLLVIPLTGLFLPRSLHCGPRKARTFGRDDSAEWGRDMGRAEWVARRGIEEGSIRLRSPAAPESGAEEKGRVTPLRMTGWANGCAVAQV